jgi:hypothetical protein
MTRRCVTRQNRGMSEIGAGGAVAARPREFPKDRKLSDAERREWMTSWLLAKAVGWEVYGLAQAVVAARDEPESMRRTLFLEATLIHQRCLIEFLAGRVNKKGVRSWRVRTDVTPAAFLDGWDPVTALPGAIAELTAMLAEIDALLAHVSLGRAEITRRTWDLGAGAATVLEALDIFVARLRLAEPFRADCLEAWTATARGLLSEAGVDLAAPLVVTPSSSVMFVVPIGESSGRAAALLGQAQQP